MTDPQTDEFEAVFARCIEFLEDGDTDAVRVLCEQHPHLEPRLRQGLEALRSLGLDRDPGAPETAFPERMGDYRLLRRLGGGGMGVVYLAEQVSLQRRVALKLVHPDHLYFPESRQRFVAEIAAIARLTHPGIVPVHDIGEASGIPYFAMEWVRGCSLAAVIEEQSGSDPKKLRGEDLYRSVVLRGGTGDQAGPPPALFRGTWTEVVGRILERLADALAHVHAHGALHGDVKPSNVMISKDGRVLLVDFGISRSTDPASSRSGSLPGTLPYLAPERLDGDAEADVRVDVYGLGVTGYEMLSLRRPFQGSSREALRRQILRNDPPSLRSQNSAVSWELETVCAAAMDRDPRRRLPTAREFQEELSRLRERRPIRTRRAGLWRRTLRWCQRRPAAAMAIALAVATLVVTTGFVLAEDLALRRLRRATHLLEREQAAHRKDLNALDAAISTRQEDLGRIKSLGDARAVRSLLASESELWPAHPEMVPALERWIDAAATLLAHRSQHAEALARLRQESLPYTPRAKAADRARREAYEVELGRLQQMLREPDGPTVARVVERRIREIRDRLASRFTWDYDGNERSWRDATLDGLLRHLTQLERVAANVRGRLRFAKRVHEDSVVRHAAAWERAMAEIAASDTYRRLRIRPIPGFVPLGADPETDLQEFLHLQTGDGVAPKRDRRHERWRMLEGTGMVFVLLPPGTFVMGARRAATPGAPDDNIDPRARGDSEPCCKVNLDAFLISKYEMTQAQWIRLTGSNPSIIQPRSPVPRGEVVTLRNPVEWISWREASTWVRRLGLDLPTEAQWEYAARAGTKTPWWTGEDVQLITRGGNVGDITFTTHALIPPMPPIVNDGKSVHTPVGRFAPNPFGLHDVIGNVSEWCRDSGVHSLPVAERTGRRYTGGWDNYFAYRGGDFRSPPHFSRSAHRISAYIDFREQSIGVRPILELPRP